MPSTNRILEGVRILAFTTGYAGPYAGRLLAQYGAEVIKIESYKGGLDSFRHYGTYKSIDAAPRFIECNLGVRSLTINLKHPVGVRLIKELAARSDGILENFRPKVLDRLGLGDEEIRKVNPGIVILKLPGFGGTGPKSSYGTWGFNLTAFSGMTYLWNHPGQERPIGSQGVYPDHLGFILGPTVMVAALLRRRLTGEGVSIDLAQVEATAYTLGVTYLETSVNGQDPQPKGNRDPVSAPHGCYRCLGEDRWCVISIGTDEEWRRFCGIMGREELAADPRFSDRRARCQHGAELDKIVESWTRSKSPEEVLELLQPRGIAAGVVKNGADLLRDPQLRHRDYFAAFSDSPIGPFEIPRSGFKIEGMTEDPLSLASRLGADTDDVLRNVLGYDEKTIAEWRAEEVLS
ncbi:MAG: CoA transferase [Deltaproteobacteria bacterium]|nr:CoA transferase [Deltaproteobacteria bacterium]